MQRFIPKWGVNSCVNWSLNPGNKALVFIHGFNGSSMETFGDFNLEFRYMPEYLEYDVFFFSYNSASNQIENNALKFLDFLNALNNDIGAIISNSKTQVLREAPYSKIVIVAHSLGAVVTRIALNYGYDDNEGWVDNCHLVLFAPAHNGAHKDYETFIDARGILKIAGFILGRKILALRQLTDVSIIIQPMANRVMELINGEGIKTFTVAKLVVWADPDQVVINRRFGSDPKAVPFENKGHQAVCKPTRNFKQPFQELAKIL